MPNSNDATQLTEQVRIRSITVTQYAWRQDARLSVAPEMSKLLAQNEERCPIPFSKKMSIRKI
jgi:hypothetical protein